MNAPGTLIAPSSSALHMATDGDKNKFDFGQRVESVKCLVVGALVGGLVLSPLAAIHDIALLPMLEPNIPLNGIGQWEFDTDMGALQAGLFAIVYRYCVRKDGKTSPQLGQGVVGAFAVTRSLGGIVVPSYCIPVSLYCTFQGVSRIVKSDLPPIYHARILTLEFFFPSWYHQVDLHWGTWTGPCWARLLPVE